MPHAIIQFLLDAGFRAVQFDGAADFDAPTTGYLARVLDDAEALLRSNVGNAAYDAADAAGVARLKRAEECAARAELWRRRAAFIDGAAVRGMDNPAWQERREYTRQADAAAAECAYWIDEFLAGGDGPDEAAVTGIAGGVVVSGPWPRASL